MRRALPVLAVLFVLVGLGWLMFGDHEPVRPEPSGRAASNFAPTTTLSPLDGEIALRVTVVDPRGAPIDDAEVVCRRAARPTIGHQELEVSDADEVSRRTDERGVAAFDLVAGDYVVEAVAAGFLYLSGSRARQTIHLADGGSLDLELVLSRGASVSGQVVSAGAGVPARVAYREVEGGTMGQEVPTKDDGTFTIRGVPPGRVRVHVRADGAGPTLSPAFEVEDGEHLEGVEIEIAIAGSIVGKLRNEAGDPLAGWVTLDDLSGVPHRATVGIDGTFRFEAVRPGSFKLVAQADGHEQATADVDVEPAVEAAVEIVLHEAFGVRGTVSRPDGGVPEAAWVLMRRGDLVDAEVAVRNGAFHIELEPPSGAQVVAVSPHHGDSVPARAIVGEDVEITLEAGGEIEGTVRTPDGQPVTQFEIGVETYEADGEVPYGPRSIGTVSFVASDGSFEFGTLRPGRYWLRAAATGFASASAGPIEVRANTTAGPLQITLGAGGTVSGRVASSDGAPLKGAQVAVFDPFSPFATARTRTAGDGTFRLEGVPTGRRSVRVAAKGYLTNVASGLDVQASREVTRQFVMEPAQKGEKFVFGGIGAVLRAEEDAIIVQEALEDRPASIFGLQAGDRIMAIDGRSTAELRLGTAVELIRGEEGVAVELELERDGEGRLTVEVERGRVVIK